MYLRRLPPRYIWKSRWPPLTVRRATSRRSHRRIGDYEQSILCATLVNWEWGFFLFNMPWRCQICVGKGIFFLLRRFALEVWTKQPHNNAKSPHPVDMLARKRLCLSLLIWVICTILINLLNHATLSWWFYKPVHPDYPVSPAKPKPPSQVYCIRLLHVFFSLERSWDSNQCLRPRRLLLNLVMQVNLLTLLNQIICVTINPPLADTS